MPTIRNLSIVTNCDKGIRFKVTEIVDGKLIGNGLRFDTKPAAKRFAKNFLSKKQGVSGYIIEQTTDNPPPSITSEEIDRRIASNYKASIDA
jgi:hypothetical protein